MEMSINSTTRNQIREIRSKLKNRIGDNEFKNDDQVIDAAVSLWHKQLKRNKDI